MENKRSSSIIFGLIIIGFGLVLLLITLNVVKTSFDIGPWWPAILIFAGALSAGSGNAAMPFGMVGVGALLLARNLGLYASDSALGGVLILLVGIGILVIAASPKRKNTDNQTRE